MNINKVFLGGNLTRDPQMNYLPSQTAVVEFGMAVNREWTKDGQKQNQVCFVEIKSFGKMAETLNQYLRKGDPVFIEGRLNYESWQTQGGDRRNKLTVTAETFQFLGGEKKAESQVENKAEEIDDCPF